ncbi:MAG: FliA/WhiG family RNA polymerase sigma factor, partial [Desulfovibrio sp.]|nr:FliA/WhiG family RNA polymerase sigma factor [Desulfovibrio sp.]
NAEHSNRPWEDFESGKVQWADFSKSEKTAIVRHYAPKIRFLALRLKNRLPQSIDLNELISAGTLGLMESLRKFSAKVGIRFETFSENRIRGAMLDDLRKLDWFPRALRQRVRIIDDAMNKFEHEKGKQPTEEELARETGLSVIDVRKALEAMQNQLWLSLDAIENTSCNDSCSSIGRPFSDTFRREIMDRVAPLVECLTPREKLVLSSYYADNLTMRETAEVMNITEGRVSQLHAQALVRLRRYFKKFYGKTELGDSL